MSDNETSAYLPPLISCAASTKVTRGNNSKLWNTTEDTGVKNRSASANLFPDLRRWIFWWSQNTRDIDNTADFKKKLKAEYTRKADGKGESSLKEWYRNGFSYLYTPTELPIIKPSEKVRYRAIGVEYEQNGVLKSAYLKSSLLHIETTGFGKRGVRSIILAAGAIMTPKLLMNSGVGPEDNLKEAGVDVLIASDMVGRNLHDHPAVGLTFMRIEREGEIEISDHTALFVQHAFCNPHSYALVFYFSFSLCVHHGQGLGSVCRHCDA